MVRAMVGQTSKVCNDVDLLGRGQWSAMDNAAPFYWSLHSTE